MSITAETEKTEDGHDHPPFLAHHFESSQQQFDSGKLGMWLFLITEILFFSGLFVVYAIYRSRHPEIFLYGHQFLDTKLGAINTVVLILSSLTMAWAVRAAQLSQQKLLIGMLTATLFFAGLFLVIKGFEYKAKFDHGLLPGRYNVLYQEQAGLIESSHGEEAEESSHDAASASDAAADAHGKSETHGKSESADPTTEHQHDAVVNTDTGDPSGTTSHDRGDSHAEEASLGGHHLPAGPVPRNAHVFFSIYFCMTGLHAVHIIAGMIAIGWPLKRSCQGHFNREYFGPVDYVGLYWHLVDLIWIYLFPLLYLIH